MIPPRVCSLTMPALGGGGSILTVPALVYAVGENPPFILHVGYKVTGEILHHLMDGVNPEELEVARLAASKAAGRDVVVRGRWMGRSLRLEVDLPVPADARVGDVAAAGQHVETAIFDALPTARQVICRPCLSPGSAPR